MHACLQMKKYAEVHAKRRFELQKARLVFHVKVVSDLFFFSLFCQVGTGKRKKKERKERKLDAEGRII